MENLMHLLSELSHYLPLLGWISLLMFLASIALIPLVLTKIPADYFVQQELTSSGTKIASIHYSLVWVLRNIAGLLLIIAGIVMLVLPGQGLLTILMGLLVADFPGKHRLERKIVTVPAVYRSINWVREKKGVEQLAQPQPE